MTFSNFKSKARQQGAATLLVVTMLALAMTVISLTTARTGIMEQQIVGNDLRAREAFEAANAGIEYGIAYLTNDSAYSNYKRLTWTNSDGNQSSLPNTASENITLGDFSYMLNVTYQRELKSSYIKVLSIATETHDNTITATNEQYVKVQFNAPPLVIDGCLDGVVGGPDLYIGTRADSIAVGTSNSSANQGVWGDGNDADNPCLKQGHLNAHGGQPVGALFPPGKAWEYIFGTTTREQIKARADAEVAARIADSDRNYVWVSDSGNYHTSWGSPTHPVILVFDAAADCPRINGSPTIYGIVFVDAPCSANGWGGAAIYGSVVINGNVSKLNANTAIHDWTDASGTVKSLGNSFSFINDGIYKIPGTWKDF